MLESIALPDRLESIGENAFDGCTKLTEIVIPDYVTWIGSYSFSSCKALTHVVIGSSVTYIGQEVFDKCTAIQSVVLPKSLEQIDTYAFEGGEIANATFYYCGSEQDFQKIDIVFGNEALTEGTIVYNYTQSK